MNDRRHPVDRIFLVLVLAELFFGLVVLKSASGPLAYERYHSSWGYVWHQFYAGVLPGLAGMWVLSRIDHRRIERLAPLIMVAALCLMAAVFIPGLAADYGTARSWVTLAGRASFQPVEFLKLALVAYLAALLSSANRTPREAFVPAGLALGGSALLLALQPDLGSLLVVVSIFMIAVFAAGVPFAYLAITIASGGAALYAFAKSASYRVARLTVFLHPELDPQGIGYQINRAFLAIGSGGFFGKGLGYTSSNASLPQVMNDSIFPVIAQELGFFLAVGLVALVAAIFFRGLKIARSSPDSFGRLFVIGAVGWLAVQSFMNIGAMLGVVPLTGVPLPLVSYGGTAMAITLWTLGIVLSVSRNGGRR
jgi:cell division protein FtsW